MVGQLGRLRDQVLAVVQDQQQLPAGQRGHQQVHGIDVVTLGDVRRDVADVQARQHRLRHAAGDGRERDEAHLAGLPRRRLDREPGLARPAWADQREQPAVPQALLDLAQLLGTADEAGDLAA
ncbi:hypothetical protein ACFMQL_22575 [Nonomuraea fastidiosa]|uniref:hypothetical protein n=1 Tax=Nonomuraea fastidiosa TaxID=46173 RepID=UPI00366A5ECF